MPDPSPQVFKAFKALSDPKRLQIILYLADGELCACQLLDFFQISQPTLSHDMKVLCEAGLVRSRRCGKNTFYSLSPEIFQEIQDLISSLGKNGDPDIL